MIESAASALELAPPPAETIPLVWNDGTIVRDEGSRRRFDTEVRDEGSTRRFCANRTLVWNDRSFGYTPGMSDPVSPEIDALLQEHRSFPPSDAFRAQANVNDPDIYGKPRRIQKPSGQVSPTSSSGSSPGRRVLDWNPPDAKWFVDGQLNVSANCLDRHVRSWRRNKAAFIWEGEPGDRRTLTYFDLYRQVCQFANVLKSLGVKKGDRVALYLPLIPELAISMLACARIGAVHSVVFGGFSAESLRDRINDATCTVLVTADGGYRRGGIVPLKQVADEALAETPSIRHVVVVQRGFADIPVHIKEGRDHWFHRLMQDAPVRLPGRTDGRGGHALHPLHVGHDRQAEGHRAHHRRLPGRRLRHHQVGLRSERRRRLLVHRRHRLGHRSQLRRLRSARQRRDGGDVRRRARLAEEGPPVGNRRAQRRDRVLHRAHRDPRVHEVGHRLAGGRRTCRRCDCSDRWANRSTPKRGSGITCTSAAAAVRWSTRGGKPRPARS